MKRLSYLIIAIFLAVSCNVYAAEDFTPEVTEFSTYQLITNNTLTKLCNRPLYTKSFNEFISQDVTNEESLSDYKECKKLDTIMKSENKKLQQRFKKTIKKKNLDMPLEVSKKIASLTRQIETSKNLTQKAKLEATKLTLQVSMFAILIEIQYEEIQSMTVTEQASVCGDQSNNLKLCAVIQTYNQGHKQ